MLRIHAQSHDLTAAMAAVLNDPFEFDGVNDYAWEIMSEHWLSHDA